MFLAAVHKVSQDPEVHFKYIEAAVKMGQLKEVERVCKESSFYDAGKVKDFLKEARLQDQLPLIIVCDRHGFIGDLTTYLYKNNLSDYIKAYVQKINSANTPQVVGTLIDLDCPEDYMRSLVLSVRDVPIDELVEQCEKRNRLRLIQPWLEARAQEGSKEASLHNALAKIAIDLNREPEKFLTTNAYYDSLVVGKYCENRDPYLAFVAYKRGMNSEELIEVTNKHNLFKNQARFLVEKQDPALWARVLAENPSRRNLIDQIVAVALPESHNSDEVSSTVKAFMAANLPKELIELLEKIVLETGTKFYGNRDLSNLLILTAIKADAGRVMEYVNRMDSYDAVDIANIAIGAGLFEEAFAILRKFKFHVLAVQVLLEHLKSIPRAVEFAERCNEADVWSKVGKAQLDAGEVSAAIDSFLKAHDPEFFNEVIAAANKASLHADLVRYLQAARKKVREPVIETELCFSLAKINKLAELEEFIAGPNCASIQQVADRCYDAGMLEAAKLLYSSVSNYGRLASTLVRLGHFGPAVDAAKKANSLRSWKEVNVACLDAKEFRLANSSGLHIIVHGDELDELIRNYESRGFVEECMSLLDQGLALDRAHVGMFTELAILYSKYRPAALMEHLKQHFSRINIPRVMRTCERNQQWAELTFLHVHYDEHDNAAQVMMAHSAEAWDHREFKEIMLKVANTDIVYKAIGFYLEEQPLLVKDLLSTLQAKVDHTRVVQLVKRLNHLPLIREYLVAVQPGDVAAVNEALHQLLIEEENFEALRTSIDTYKNYDGVALAQTLEKHAFLEFRRLGAYLYKRVGRFAQSMDISKGDQLWKDAMATAAESKDPAVAEALLRFFVSKEMAPAFAACLAVCYDLIHPDVALELAWKAKMMDFAMPYIVNVVKEYVGKVDALTSKAKEKETEAFGASSGEAVGPGMGMAPPMGVVPMYPHPGGFAPPGVYMAPPAGFAPGFGPQ
jgi:clathrin heavy chain